MAALPILLCAAESDPGAKEAFRQLQSLIGNWEGKFEDGRAHGLSYRLTAAGTVLVETWTLAPGRESMTLYSMDGNNLIATHYCPQGNQPRLQFASGSDPGQLTFEFRDGTNLQVKDKSHQHAFWIRLLGENSFERSETYVENGSTASAIADAEQGKAIAYTRIGSIEQER
jgi:hypothetical protein